MPRFGKSNPEDASNLLAEDTDATAAETPVQEEAYAPNVPEAPKEPNATFIAEVDTWFREVVHHSPLSRNTQVFNATREAVEDLKQRLAHLEV